MCKIDVDSIGIFKSLKNKKNRHVMDASWLVAAKPQPSKATLSSVTKPLETVQASVLLLQTLIASGREVWYNIISIFYLLFTFF